ncbi:hypothetical protein MSG28_009728 [Choristoneura fumiferana]|uniref:Uncharacterized protein n=1 Tax=Choristoneura fumiferana TaxID=7141 RepID=A0ACC0JCE2_CHOFU|nr:hypothetical protein MSG28_009728 [Choristoneura fumiferana]
MRDHTQTLLAGDYSLLNMGKRKRAITKANYLETRKVGSRVGEATAAKHVEAAAVAARASCARAPAARQTFNQGSASQVVQN